MTPELLKELGLEAASNNLSNKINLKNKLTIAYEHFRFVEPHVFERFNDEMKTKTLKIDNHNQYQRTETYRRLKFVALKDYKEIPPPDCLMDLKKAKEFNCFDSFEVATVEEVSNYYDTTPIPDPIIFGCINGCVDKFFITQWDDDVSIEEILKESEV
jgi:hypothetical protein